MTPKQSGNLSILLGLGLGAVVSAFLVRKLERADQEFGKEINQMNEVARKINAKREGTYDGPESYDELYEQAKFWLIIVQDMK